MCARRCGLTPHFFSRREPGRVCPARRPPCFSQLCAAQRASSAAPGGPMACSASREAEAGRVSASRAGGHAPRTGERVARKSASRACFCVTASLSVLILKQTFLLSVAPGRSLVALKHPALRAEPYALLHAHRVKQHVRPRAHRAARKHTRSVFGPGAVGQTAIQPRAPTSAEPLLHQCRAHTSESSPPDLSPTRGGFLSPPSS